MEILWFVISVPPIHVRVVSVVELALVDGAVPACFAQDGLWPERALESMLLWKFWCFLHPWHDITCDWAGCLISVIRNWLFRAFDSVWDGILGIMGLIVI